VGRSAVLLLQYHCSVCSTMEESSAQKIILTFIELFYGAQDSSARTAPLHPLERPSGSEFRSVRQQIHLCVLTSRM
jgi:hypothetical protein